MRTTPGRFTLRFIRARLRISLAVLAVVGALGANSVSGAPGAHGPDGEHLDSPSGANASGLARLPDGSVNVPIEAQRRLGIRTRIVTASQAQAAIELPARVVMDPNAGGRVQAAQAGRIEPGPDGLPVAGQRVTMGEVLAWVRYQADPIEKARQDAQWAELRNGRILAAQRLRRLESLQGTVPRKEIEAARAELRSLRERERSIGASVEARDALVAPVSGVIARADAVSGQVVDARELLFEIVDPSRLMVEATTPDATLPARVDTASLIEAPDARLQLVGAGGALRDGVLPISFRLQAASPGQVLPLAMGQPVTLIARLAERIDGFVLPAQAVVRSVANEQVVWIKSGVERYIPQPVRVRKLAASVVIVTHGLGADNRVVVEGAALLAQIR